MVRSTDPIIFFDLSKFKLKFHPFRLCQIINMPRRGRHGKRFAPAGQNMSERHSMSVANRGAMVQLREDGFSHAQIAQQCGVSRTTVFKWLRR